MVGVRLKHEEACVLQQVNTRAKIWNQYKVHKICEILLIFSIYSHSLPAEW